MGNIRDILGKSNGKWKLLFKQLKVLVRVWGLRLMV